jgi:light-regulated signal transduction histidine kinase (bacteriophytochrome)
MLDGSTQDASVTSVSTTPSLENVITSLRIAPPADIFVESESTSDPHFLRMQQQLAQAERDLCEMSADLQVLRDALVHELRSPLRQLRGIAEALRREYATSTPGQVNLQLDRIIQEARAADSLMDDLLKVIGIARAPIQRRAISMNASVAAAMRQLLPVHQSRQIEWQIEDLSNAVCDSECVTRVFVCLLANALKFTESRDAVKIRVGEMMLEGERVLFVQDNGVDFGAQFAPALVRLSNCTATAGEVTSPSASIALAARIVRRLGGRMWSQSRVDAGVTFLFTLAPEHADETERARS